MSIVLRSRKTQTQRAIAYLRTLGADAHVWLPGIGALNGLQAGNYLDSAGTTLATVDNPVGKVNDATGSISATQATTANKPMLRRGLLNLLTWSGDFSNAAWAKTGATATPSMLTEDTSTGLHGVIRYSGWPSATAATAAYVVSAGTATKCWIGNASAATAVLFDLTTGTIEGTIGAIVGSITPFGAGAYLIAAQHTAAAAQTLLMGMYTTFVASNYNASVSYAGTSRTLNVSASALFAGTLTAQQILAQGGIPLTTTAAVSNPSAGSYAWQFDGNNDSMALSSPVFQMSDNHCVIAGASSTAGASDRYILDHGNTASVNAMVASLALNGTTVRAYWRDDSLLSASLSGGVLAQGSIGVLSARKVSTACVLRLNGQQVATGTISAGATTITGASIGLRVSPGNFFTGRIFPIIAIKGTVPDDKLLLLEKLVAKLSGVTL